MGTPWGSLRLLVVAVGDELGKSGQLGYRCGGQAIAVQGSQGGGKVLFGLLVCPGAATGRVHQPRGHGKLVLV